MGARWPVAPEPMQRWLGVSLTLLGAAVVALLAGKPVWAAVVQDATPGGPVPSVVPGVVVPANAHLCPLAEPAWPLVDPTAAPTMYCLPLRVSPSALASWYQAQEQPPGQRCPDRRLPNGAIQSRWVTAPGHSAGRNLTPQGAVRPVVVVFTSAKGCAG